MVNRIDGFACVALLSSARSSFIIPVTAQEVPQKLQPPATNNFCLGSTQRATKSRLRSNFASTIVH
jgi:hypothetical protein